MGSTEKRIRDQIARSKRIQVWFWDGVREYTGEATSVGTIFSGGGFKAIAFAPDGTLYSVATFDNTIHELNPANAAITRSVGINPPTGGALGMGVRPSDGMIFLTTGSNPFGMTLFRVDPANGSSVVLPDFAPTGRVHDLAFLR